MSKNMRNLIIAAVALIVVLVLVVVAVSSSMPVQETTAVASAPVTSGQITPAQYTSQYAEAGTPHLLIDVRTPEEFASGHLPNAVNISLQDLPARLGEVPADEPVVLYCRSGNRSAQAATLLNDAGYTQVLDLGGIIDWQAAGYQVVQ
ncbi:MAG TPA: rhodanese-like domain-containing protein [Candidatus Limnocylindrales bacterium]|nr:rhodanese-like domain-containing protein [Candidatus Limnocylindrales bacterium]